MKAIVVPSHGGPEVLEYKDAEPPQPSEGQLLVDVTYAGINYIDTYYREGIYNASVPFIPGFEGAGRVVHDPKGEIAEGTMVAWDHAFGSYAEQVCVPRNGLVAVPDDFPTEIAASMLLQGMTAHFLSHGVYELGEGATCLITAGAGGVGQLLTQMASSLGATVYTVVSTDEKEEISYKCGADHVFRYSDGLGEQVRRFNGGRGVDVVYDGVGKTTFPGSLSCLRPRGLFVSFGNASGPVPPFPLAELNNHGSLFATRPKLNDYVGTRKELLEGADTLFAAVINGKLHVPINHAYALKDAAKAHIDLESRATTGAAILRP